eukprot:g6884.t1
MRLSRLLLPALAAIPRASGFYFCVPLSSTYSGIRAWTATGSGSSSSSATSRRPLSVGPLALARKRGAARPTMDAGEDFDQLDGHISGMPETINVLTNANSTATTATPPLIDLRFGGVTFGRGGGGVQTTKNAVHTILPTGGAFDLPLPDVVTPDANAAPPLPEYSLENDRASDDLAASVATEIAHKIAEGKKIAENTGTSSVGRAIDGGNQAPSTFRAAALKSVTDNIEIRERRAAEIGTRAGTGKAKGPAGIDTMRVPNLWLAVAHSSSLKAGEVKKVEVDGVPIALWRTALGDISAQSDVCIHRGASLARGWIANNRLVCPYHGFEFESSGHLVHMPGAGPPKSSAATAKASEQPAAAKAKDCGGRKAPTYPVKEVGGWIYIFPDETRPGSVEQHRDPFVIPEAVSPEFRAVEGSMDFKGGVDASVENMLDMLHISFVHSFGNQQDPTPFAVSYEKGFDDPGTDAMVTSQVTFRYRSGNKSFSKVIGKSTEVVVKNEFHLPYRAVIRVYFGKNSLKTIEATAVPKSDGETTLHWRLYRNFAITHPRDEGPINKAGDFLFQQMMELTLREDKDIIENIYPEYQHGFINARYDQQMLQYRKAITNFQAIAAERANTQLESSLQMELLHRISRSQRGLASSRDDRLAILDLIKRLEGAQATQVPPSDVSAAAEAAEAAAAEVEEALMVDESVEGEWHLEYVSNAGEGLDDGWDFTGSTDLQKEQRVAALKEAGGEALLFDWNEKGRPLWADTSESVQIIDTKARTLTNRAVYKGWSGFTTTVQLDAVIEPLQDQANRLAVGFHKAIVNVAGMRVTFPHLQRFSPAGWMETTYLNTGIRIARGNKGSIFVLTRHPVSSSGSA